MDNQTQNNTMVQHANVSNNLNILNDDSFSQHPNYSVTKQGQEAISQKKEKEKPQSKTYLKELKENKSDLRCL